MRRFLLGGTYVDEGLAGYGGVVASSVDVIGYVGSLYGYGQVLVLFTEVPVRLTFRMMLR